ncbi:MAG: DUF354 domain-containing protein [Thermotogae bacterium]|nr:DUF354 domain-containing protein [Thermotogota bacterium]
MIGGTVWVDLANSPHVMFFAPIVKELERRGFKVVVTARDFSETLNLARIHFNSFWPVGRYGGKSKFAKGLSFVSRISALYGFLKDKKVRLALSHNSYDAIVSGRLLGARVWTFMDYDGQPANHLAFRLAHRVFVPEWFPDEALRRFGASSSKVIKYRGLKEEVYLSGFRPDRSFLNILGDFKRPLVVARPPSTSALYGKGYGEFWEILEVLKSKNYDLRVLQRNPGDVVYIKRLGIKSLPKPIDGPQLLYWSDAFIGGGGTMTREAIILGSRAFTTLPVLGSLDRMLMKIGLLERITKAKAKVLRITERRNRFMNFFNKNLLEFFVEIIERCLHSFAI